MTEADKVVKDFQNNRISRKQFLFKAMVLGLSTSSIAAIITGCGGGNGASGNGQVTGQGSVTLVSPRGTLEVIDDFPYWVAKRFGWFGDVENKYEPGPSTASATTNLVAQNQADMGYPSVGVFSLALDSGTPLTSIWCMGAGDVFGFAFRKDSGYESMEDLQGARILLGDPGWKSICDPEFAQLDLDPASNNYVSAGSGWAQNLAEGQGDAALTWEGLRAQWEGQGLDFDYILGRSFSEFPANSFVVREKDLEDDSLRQLYTSYLRGWAMGMEFSHRYPREAAQITLEQIPALKEQMGPPVAVEGLLQLDAAFRGNWEQREGWGEHDFESYKRFFETVRDLGQISEDIDPKKVISNELVADANDFEASEIDQAAEDVGLAPEYERVDTEEIRQRLSVDS